VVQYSGESALAMFYIASGLLMLSYSKGIQIKQGKEFFSSYDLAQETSASPIYETKIYAYRRATPPKFVTFPGMLSLFHSAGLNLNNSNARSGRSDLQPGFDVVCKVKADLTACLDAHRVLKGKDNGKEYKKVAVRAICFMLITVMVKFSLLASVQDRHRFRGNRDYRSYALAGKCGTAQHHLYVPMLMRLKGIAKHGHATIAYE
jgi:hypothetical protein